MRRPDYNDSQKKDEIWDGNGEKLGGEGKCKKEV
jgi:hypothetical protein